MIYAVSASLFFFSFLFILSSVALLVSFFFFFNDTATTEIYTLSLHDALPIYPGGDGHCGARHRCRGNPDGGELRRTAGCRSEEHTSELQSLAYLVCRLLLEKKKNRSAAVPGAGHRHTPHNQKHAPLYPLCCIV